MKLFNFSFNDVDWGKDEASGDSGLSEYFVEFPEYANVLLGEKRYIIGRKGSGKSAILERIKISSDHNPQVFHSFITLRNFPYNYFRDLGDPKFRDKSKYVPAWKFLLLLEMAKLVVNDNSVSDENLYKKELEEFILLNFPGNIGMIESLNSLKERSNKLTVSLGWLSGEDGKANSMEKHASVHYQLVTDYLQKLLYSLDSDSTYYILADELDEGYVDTDAGIKLVILSLLRACEEIATFFQGSRLKCHPIVALRSDIFDNFSDNDLNKLDDYILRLKWTIDEQGDYSIKRVVEGRIRRSFCQAYPGYELDNDTLWNLVFDEGSYKEGLWKYMSILTLDRPRDIIKLLKYCKNGTVESKLSYSTVSTKEIDYSAWLYREFRDEVQSFLPCWKSVLNCLTEISRGKSEVDILKNFLLSNDEVKAWLDETKKQPIAVVEILFNYSVIGCINENGRWIFKYKDDYLEFMPSYKFYCIHYGFIKKLRITNSYRPLILAEIYKKS